ncbi:MAG: M20/M25/M40 family metallo-hydrolase [Bacillota bacterium]|nr:M20/M25/M40 family metallo-hydrolase [Bacillota bacterium]
MDDINRVIERNRQRYLDDLFTLLRQPSISAQDTGVRECARLLQGLMEEAGIRTRIFETARHPVVYGEAGEPDAEKAILVYGHYDVQPPEPLAEWLSPPFEPSVRDGKIYGRGSSDNKGQLFAHVKGLQSYLEARGGLPRGLKMKYIFEGEEEISSPNLEGFAAAHKDLLKADAAIFSDSHVHESGFPTVILGLKGMLYIELVVKTIKQDMHSLKAASLPSPVWRLVTLLSHIKGEDGVVKIPGYYDDVRRPTAEEIRAVEAIPYEKVAIMRDHGASHLIQGRTTDHYYYNLTFEPTANIAGIFSGYQGKGSKTVLPAEAHAKLDLRLVPDQKPKRVLNNLRDYLDDLGYNDVRIEVHGELEPSRTPLDNPWVAVAVRAVRKAYSMEPVIYPGIGGSGPNYVFTGTLGMPCVLVPFAAHDQANHAPNENMILEGYFNGIRTAAAIIDEAAKA